MDTGRRVHGRQGASEGARARERGSESGAGRGSERESEPEGELRGTDLSEGPKLLEALSNCGRKAPLAADGGHQELEVWRGRLVGPVGPPHLLHRLVLQVHHYQSSL